MIKSTDKANNLLNIEGLSCWSMLSNITVSTIYKTDRKSVVEGKNVDSGGPLIL